MTREMLTHLSEESLDDVLIGMGGADSHAHLARCAECRARVEQFTSDVELFNTASMAWSEAHPRRMPELTLQAPARRMPFALMGSAIAAALAVVVALSVGHHGSTLQENKAVIDVQVEDSQTQITQDNQLMEAVNAAIGPEEDSPMVEFGLSENRDKHMNAHPK